jgi:hypothetical protein
MGLKKLSRSAKYHVHPNTRKLHCYSRYDGEAPFEPPLSELSRILQSQFELTSPELADYYLALDHHPKQLKRVKRAGIPRKNRFLVVREPRQVHPYSHSKNVSRDYGNVFYMGAVNGDELATKWPYDHPTGKAVSPNRDHRQNRAVAIAGWRVSFIRGSLYSLRSSAYETLEIDLFGRGWESSLLQRTKEIIANLLLAAFYWRDFSFNIGQITRKPKNFMGQVSDKLATASRYKVSVVIENSLDYFSEKLFDALVARTIPVYCGPDPALLGLPRGLVIWCQPNLESIRAGLEIAKLQDYDAWSSLLDTWLKEFDDSSPLRANHVWNELVEQVASRISSR